MENNVITPTSEVVRDFMMMTGCSQVFLYGGAAIDRYMDPAAKIMDYDLAIKNLNDYWHTVQSLYEQGFDVGQLRFSHNLSTTAKHPKYGVFDLSCMDIRQNGIYNIEKFYIEFSKEYPNGRAVDAYGAVAGLREGKIEIVNNPQEEQSYDLLRRFAVLAGKYDFSLDKNGINKTTIDVIKQRLQETPLNKKTEHSRVRCLSRFLGAAFRSKNMAKYLEGMGQTELLQDGFPSINEVLHSFNFINDIKKNRPDGKLELIQMIAEAAKNRDEIIDEMSLLQKREPDREDARVINKAVELAAEKTSIKRLQNKIINPIFLYALSREKGK